MDKLLTALNKTKELTRPTNNAPPITSNANEIVNKIIESEELRKEIFSSFCKALISIINTHEGFFKEVFEKKLNDISEKVIEKSITDAINNIINADFIKSILSSEEIAKYLSHEIPPENQPSTQPVTNPNMTSQQETSTKKTTGGTPKKKKTTRKYKKI